MNWRLFGMRRGGNALMRPDFTAKRLGAEHVSNRAVLESDDAANPDKITIVAQVVRGGPGLRVPLLLVGRG